MAESLADLVDSQQQSSLGSEAGDADNSSDADKPDETLLVPMIPDPLPSLSSTTPLSRAKRSRTGRKNNRNRIKRPEDELADINVANSTPFQSEEFSGPDAAHESTGYLGRKDLGVAYQFLEGYSHKEQQDLLLERGYTFHDPDPRLVFPFQRKTDRVWLTRRS